MFLIYYKARTQEMISERISKDLCISGEYQDVISSSQLCRQKMHYFVTFQKSKVFKGCLYSFPLVLSHTGTHYTHCPTDCFARMVKKNHIETNE